MAKCLFCSIVNGEMKADIVYEDAHVMAFNDISPQAPVHVLIIPREHIESFQHIEIGKNNVMDYVVKAAQHIAAQKGLDKDGYRIVTNHGKRAGQSVFHLHFHLLGGRDMQWPPG